MKFLDCHQSIFLNSRVSVLRLVFFAFNDMHQSIYNGNCQSFKNDASDISFLVVHPLYMLTSSP